MSSLTLAKPDTIQPIHMALQLQDLPDELIVEVLSYLPKSHLKSSRLTCTRFARVGAQLLFQRVYFAPRKSAIETFLNISANPVFARTVTELIYDGRLFLPELTAYKSYKKAFDAQLLDGNIEESGNADDAGEAAWRKFTSIGWQEPAGQEYQETLADTLVHYTRLFDQQQSIFEDRRDYDALSAGLKNLPNITTVTALDDFLESCCWMPPKTDDHSWYHQRSQCEIAGPIAPTSWTRENTNEDDDLTKWDVRGVHNLIRAVSKHAPKVAEFTIASEISKAPSSMFEMDQDIHDDACMLAQRLKLFKANVYLSMTDIRDEWLPQEDCLDSLLSHAKELRCLAVSGRINIRAFIKQIWPHLETLLVGDIALGADDLKAITQAHKGTLRELTFRNVYLCGEEGWADAAKEIGKYLRLRQVSILGVCDDVSRAETGNAYLEDEVDVAVARSFMQSIPRTTRLDKNHFTILACSEEGKDGGSHPC